MQSKIHIICVLFACLGCGANNTGTGSIKITDPVAMDADGTNPYSSISKIPLPAGYARMNKPSGSFAGWLGNVVLKKNKTVYLFDGKPKANQTAQFAVLDISLGKQNLQQCADAVMRLRAEYLFAVKKYKDIRFTDNGGAVYQFGEPYSYKNLQQYLLRVFAMCGTASLAKQLHPVSFTGIEPGDVIIRGGFPGHAVTVMDVAINGEGKKIYLIAQSYMPAQDIHVLVNPVNKIVSPWYEVNEAALIYTPEYVFSKGELKRW